LFLLLLLKGKNLRKEIFRTLKFFMMKVRILTELQRTENV